MRHICVIGNPIAHSLSPLLHNAIFHTFSLPYRYGRYKLDNAHSLQQIFYKLGLHGANITIPFKEQAARIASSLSPLATHIQAVNTLVAQRHNLIGYNTDAPGFLMSLVLEGYITSKQINALDASKELALLAPLLHSTHHVQNPPLHSALILGAGGSAKAIAYALHMQHIPVLVANRTNTQREFFAQLHIPYCLSSELDTNTQADLIINATSASLQDTLPLPASILAPILSRAKLGYDVMYGKPSPFYTLSKECNTAYKDGADMLILQALGAILLFCKEVSEIASVKELYTIMKRVFPNTQAR